MTREEWKERLPLIQAFCEGRAIQIKQGSVWHDFVDGRSADFTSPAKDYRIKPEPRKVWLMKQLNEDFAHASHHLYVTKLEAENAMLAQGAWRHIHEIIELVEVLP